MGAPREGFGKVLERRKQTTGVATSTADHGTKNKNLKNPEEGKIPSFPGDYEILGMRLSSPNKEKGGYIDLQEPRVWVDLSLYEDIFSPSLTGKLQIADGVGLAETLPIIGEETVHINIRTKGIKKERSGDVEDGPFTGSDSTGVINIKMRVYKLTNYTKVNEGLFHYTLHLVSEEYIMNLKSKVRKTTLDPTTLEPRRISATIKQLYKQFFSRGRIAKKIFVEPTRNLTDIIIPNQSPFQAFNFLASRAVSAGKHAVGSSFVFYETVRGFFFVSLETLMAGGGTGYGAGLGTNEGASAELEYVSPERPVKETYVVGPKQAYMSENPLENIAIEMTSVDEYSFSSNFDILKNLTGGMYASRLLTHDIIRMKYDTLDYNYLNPENLEKQVEYPEQTAEAVEALAVKKLSEDARHFHDQFTHLGEGRLASENQFAMGAPESVISFYPTNFAHDARFPIDPGSKGVKGGVPGNLNIIPNRVEEWMQSRMAQSQQINNLKLNIKAPGLSTRTVGDLIEFKFPTMDLEDRDGKTPSQHHKYYSGYYLITKLRHHFTWEKYEIEFEAMKDSYVTRVGKEKAEADSPRSNHSET